MTLAEVDVKDFSNLRLTCRRIASFATPKFAKAFFTKINLTYGYRSLNNLVQIVRHPWFGAFTREIKLGATCHSQLMAFYSRRFRHYDAALWAVRLGLTLNAWEHVCVSTDDEDKLASYGGEIVFLITAFEELIRRKNTNVVFGIRGDEDIGVGHSRYPAAILSLFNAAQISGFKIQTLLFDCNRYNPPRLGNSDLAEAGHTMSPESLDSIRDIQFRGQSVGQHNGYVLSPGLLCILMKARKVESITLAANIQTVIYPGAHGMHWPELRKITLSHVSMNGGDLGWFIDVHNSTLKEITIDMVALNAVGTGGWRVPLTAIMFCPYMEQASLQWLCQHEVVRGYLPLAGDGSTVWSRTGHGPIRNGLEEMVPFVVANGW